MNHEELLRQEAERRLGGQRAGVSRIRQPAPAEGPTPTDTASAPDAAADTDAAATPETAATPAPITAEQVTRLQERYALQEHELHVHQIELEIQNEELRRANAELELAHSRAADLYEFAPVGYLLLSDSGLIEQINLTACTLLGAVRQQLLGRRLSLFVESDQRVAFAALMQQSIQAAGELAPPLRAELRMMQHDGSAWDAQLECVAVADRPRRLIRAVLTDITALKSAQREVERLNATLEQQVEQRAFQARQLTEELQTLVYSVTHDMTRPLRQIQGFSDLLCRSMKVQDEKTGRYLGYLRQATEQMNEQMSALMAFFQSKQPLNHRQQLDLNRVVDSVFHELESELRDRQVLLTHDRLPMMRANLISLKTVFSNLLSNALKFTRSRGEATVHVGVEERGDSYLFSVRDNGVGFDTRQSGRLFGLFQRLHHERDYEGQGMGLALVRRIVQRYQGRVWAESVLDQGAVFWVQLPRDPVPVLDGAEPLY